MADRTVTGSLELNARGVEILSQIDQKLDKVTSTGRVTSVATSFVAWNEVVNRLSQGFDLAKRGVEAVLEAGMQVERTRATWTALLGDQEAVNKQLKELEGFASRAPFTFGNIQQAAIQLQATGRLSMEALKAAGDAAAIFQTDITEAANAMIRALQGETDPIKRFAISVADIQAELGHKMVESTRRTAKDNQEIWDATIRLMERRGVDGMSKVMQTVSGQLTNLTDAWERAKKQIGGEMMGGASTGLESALTMLNRMLADGTFERAGRFLGEMLSKAMDKVADVAGRQGTISELMQRSGKGGFSEYVLSPELSSIPQRRKGVGIVGDVLRERGEDYRGLAAVNPVLGLAVLGSKGYELPAKYDAIADRVALMLLTGTPESEARAYASSALMQMAFVGVKEGPPFSPPPRPMPPKAPPSSSGQGPIADEEKRWWMGTEYAGLFELAGMTPEAEEKAKRDRDVQEAMRRAGMGGALRPRTRFGPKVEELGQAGLESELEIQRQHEENLREMGLQTYTILGDAASRYAEHQSMVWERILRDGTGAYEGMQAASAQAVNVMTTWGELLVQKETRRHLTIKAMGEWAIKSEIAAFLGGIAKKQGLRAAEDAAEAASAAAQGLLTGNPLAWAAAAAYGESALQHAAVAGLAGGAAAVMTQQANRAMGAIRNPQGQLGQIPASGGDQGAGGGTTGSARLVASATAPANYTFAITINHNGATVYGRGGAEQFWHDEMLPLAQEAAASGQLSVDPMRR